MSDRKRPFCTGAVLGVVATLLIVMLVAPDGRSPSKPGRNAATSDVHHTRKPPAPGTAAGPARAISPPAVSSDEDFAPPTPAAGIDDDVKAAIDSPKDGAVRSSAQAAELLADTSMNVELPSKDEVAAARQHTLPPGVTESPEDDAIRTMLRTFNASGVFRRHRDFVALRNRLIRRLTAARAAGTFNEDGSGTGSKKFDGCVEFLRAQEQPSDTMYRVPCVPRGAPGLVSVRHAPFGVVATFRHRELGASLAAAKAAVDDPGTTLPPMPNAATAASSGDGGTKTSSLRRVAADGGSPLRVAVEMSGQMRTYRRCAPTARANVLEPNGALLFLATYPDLGDKRVGGRSVEQQDPEVDVAELRQLYGADHLAAAYLVDLPTARGRLMRGFPTLFVLKQWSWMIYQFLMMELTHNTTRAHVGLATYEESFGGVPYVDHVEVFGNDTSTATTTAHEARGKIPEPGASWGGFDVFVRLRPDLWVMGRMRFVRPPTAPAETAHMLFDCGGEAYPRVEFNATTVLRSPHHPIYLWPMDPLSDHSAIGLPPAMNAFLRLFSDTVHREPAAQEKRVFYHGNTAERLWWEHAVRQGLLVKRVPGWHLMLRNPGAFKNGTLVASDFKKKLISIIFGATDPNVGCPAIDNCNAVLTHKPKKKVGGGKKFFAKPGFNGKDCG